MSVFDKQMMFVDGETVDDTTGLLPDTGGLFMPGTPVKALACRVVADAQAAVKVEPQVWASKNDVDYELIAQAAGHVPEAGHFEIQFEFGLPDPEYKYFKFDLNPQAAGTYDNVRAGIVLPGGSRWHRETNAW